MKQICHHLWQFLWMIVFFILSPVVLILYVYTPISWNFNWIDWIMDQMSDSYTNDSGPL